MIHEEKMIHEDPLWWWIDVGPHASSPSQARRRATISCDSTPSTYLDATEVVRSIEAKQNHRLTAAGGAPTGDLSGLSFSRTADAQTDVTRQSCLIELTNALRSFVAS